MIQGGIQGDEDAGFIAAQILSRAHVAVGNLIIVPRANVPSINIHKRTYNVDLNRRFDKDYDQYVEDNLARTIKFLVSKCDGLIHLHEGSGFYHPIYKDNLHGPHRYGQSVIIDTEIFHNTLFLKKMATAVLERVNQTIVPQKWRFRLFNTKTFSTKTKYPEQQKSLSFYAVNHLNIPAFAIEVSKDIKNLEWKIQRQVDVTLGLLNELGVTCIIPDIDSKSIKQWYTASCPFYMNGQPIKNQPILLEPHTPFTISLSSSFLYNGREYAVYTSLNKGYNLLNHEYIPLVPFKRLELVVDGKIVKRIPVFWKGTWPKQIDGKAPLWVYSLNDTLYYTPSGTTVDVFEGDQLILEGIWHGSEHEVLNIKGFVADKGKNTGQDAQVPLMVSKANFMKKYLDLRANEHWQFRAVRETPGAKRDMLRFRVIPQSVKAFEIMAANATRSIIPTSAKQFTLCAGTYHITDIWTQGTHEDAMMMVDAWPVTEHDALVWKAGESHTVSLYTSRTFKPIHTMLIHIADGKHSGTYP